MTVRRYRIEGKIYLAESPNSAYFQHMKNWRKVELSDIGFAVSVFVEHPDRPITAENLQLGTSCGGFWDFCDSLPATAATFCAE